MELVPPRPLVRRSAEEVAAWFDNDFLAPLAYDAEMDGLLLQTPVDDAVKLAEFVDAALRDALMTVGVPATVDVRSRPTWGESPQPTRCGM